MILIIVHLFEERTPVAAGVQESNIVDIDADNRDPQMCTFYASDIYGYEKYMRHCIQMENFNK